MKTNPKNQVDKRKLSQIPDADVFQIQLLLDELQEFAEIIPEQDDAIQVLMKNYVIIRLTSIIEHLMKSLISELIDDLDIMPENILNEDVIHLNLDVLNTFNSGHITKGSMIVAHLDYLNAKKLSHILSRINRLNVFDWFDSVHDIKKSESDLHSFTQLNTIFLKRNDVVHNLVDIDDSVKSLIAQINGIKTLIIQLYYFTQINVLIFDKHYSDKKIEQKFGAIFEKASDINRFLPKFKSVTRQFRENFSPRKPYTARS